MIKAALLEAKDFVVKSRPIGMLEFSTPDRIILLTIECTFSDGLSTAYSTKLGSLG